MRLAELVLDAGPLIALFRRDVPEHTQTVSGFQQLVASSTTLIVPSSIVFEVFKRMLYDCGSDEARIALQNMFDIFKIEYTTPTILLELDRIMTEMPNWNGSLEDANVAFLAIKSNLKAWTFNYRDLAAFQDLEFWTPSA